MKTPPYKLGMIFADLHCHLSRPKNTKQAEHLVKKLSSGITGITSVWDSEIATYSELVQDLHLREIEKGLLARVEYKGNKGYVLKTQEVAEGRVAPHFLVLAPKKNIRNDLESGEIIEEAHRQKTIAIITHPFTIPATIDDFLINKILRKPFIKYRLINEEECDNLKKLYPLVDEVEVFNAQNINAIPWLLDMTLSNKLALDSLLIYNQRGKKFVGIASSDTHSRLEQIQRAGIYLPGEKESYLLESIIENIKRGEFERDDKYNQYVNKPSFVAGMFPFTGKFYDLGFNLYSFFEKSTRPWIG